jgi:uncharacterized protein with beta-barrel porin domain
MEHAKLYIVNLGLCIMYILSKWIQSQYGGKPYYNLGAFHVNQHSRTLREISLEGANNVQNFPKLFPEIEQYHARNTCFK